MLEEGGGGGVGGGGGGDAQLVQPKHKSRVLHSPAISGMRFLRKNEHRKNTNNGTAPAISKKNNNHKVPLLSCLSLRIPAPGRHRAANHSLNPAQPAAQPCSPPSQLTAQPAAQTAAPGSQGYLGSPVVSRFYLRLVSMAVVAPC